MTNNDETRVNETLPNDDEQDRIQQLPQPPPMRVGEGSSQSSDPLAGLGRLLEQVLSARTPDEHSARNRVSRAQRDFHQQKPPTFSGGGASMSADRWLSAVEEAFRATDIMEDDLRLKTAPSLFREEAVIWWETEMRANQLHLGT